jgi:hypothetical protein
MVHPVQVIKKTQVGRQGVGSLNRYKGSARYREQMHHYGSTLHLARHPPRDDVFTSSPSVMQLVAKVAP